MIDKSISAGYEHVHEFVHWIFGTGIGHSGVRINVQHWQDNVSSRYSVPGKKREPFFGKYTAKCREFVQTGMACWSCSIPLEATSTCCNLECIGGDGTHIGISSRKAVSVESIWEPDKPRPSRVNWNRASRRPASFKTTSEDDVKLDEVAAGIGSDVSAACKFAVAMLRDSERKVMHDQPELETKLDLLPTVIRSELIRWYAGLTAESSQWKPLQQILLSAVSSESISGAFPVSSLKPLNDLLRLHEVAQTFPNVKRMEAMSDFLQSTLNLFNTHVMPFHVWKLVQSQVQSFDSDGGMLDCTFRLIHFLGKLDLLRNLLFIA